MKSRIVVFGATGYTGHLIVEALIKRKINPVIAGRNRDSLEKMSQRLGNLEIAIADINEPESVQRLVQKGDVLVSAVGPFILYGKTAVEAAIAAGAHYIDSTGEPYFIQQISERYGAKAKEAGLILLTACGYDYVPGNCAGAVALERAGQSAVQIDIGYYLTGGLDLSQGTKSSIICSVMEPGIFWNKGKYINKYGGTKLRHFKFKGKSRPGISVASSEHIFLPEHFTHLNEVNVYLGWFGIVSYVFHLNAMISSIAFKIPGFNSMLKSIMTRVIQSRGEGPGSEKRLETGSHIIAIAYDSERHELAKAELIGLNGYTFTADMIAIMAENVANGQVEGTGALGPVQALGLKKLINACEEAGLKLE